MSIAFVSRGIYEIDKGKETWLMNAVFLSLYGVETKRKRGKGARETVKCFRPFCSFHLRLLRRSDKWSGGVCTPASTHTCLSTRTCLLTDEHSKLSSHTPRLPSRVLRETERRRRSGSATIVDSSRDVLFLPFSSSLPYSFSFLSSSFSSVLPVCGRTWTQKEKSQTRATRDAFSVSRISLLTRLVSNFHVSRVTAEKKMKKPFEPNAPQAVSRTHIHPA